MVRGPLGPAGGAKAGEGGASRARRIGRSEARSARAAPHASALRLVLKEGSTSPLVTQEFNFVSVWSAEVLGLRS